MKEEDKTVGIAIRSLAAFCIVLVLSITGSCQYSKYALKKMVEAGADPISAACAMGGGANGRPSSVECAAYTAARAKTGG